MIDDGDDAELASIVRLRAFETVIPVQARLADVPAFPLVALDRFEIRPSRLVFTRGSMAVSGDSRVVPYQKDGRACRDGRLPIHPPQHWTGSMLGCRGRTDRGPKDGGLPC